jgi:hypothetical protein
MKKLILLFPLLLTACATDSIQLIAPEYKIVKAPDELYNCPTVTKFPKAATLTDQQVGALLLKIHKNNETCKNSMEAVKKFYDDAEQTVNKK